MRLLCISDIHGHADALAAVLATAERRGFARILVAGDLCFPGPKPLETWRRLTQAQATCVQGVGDRALATLDLANVRARSEHERARLGRLEEVRTELGQLILARIARLPQRAQIPLEDGSELLLVHGSPADPLEPITHDMTDDEVASLLGDLVPGRGAPPSQPRPRADVVICGGSHVPFDRTVAGIRVINVGSVGEAPANAGGHGIIAHADATFIETRAGEVRVEQFVVPLGKAA